jgi:uncharacterized membrane protein (UPF0127 family)
MESKNPRFRILLVLLMLGSLSFPPAALAREELSPSGNPITWVKLGQVKVKAEVVFSPEKLYLGLGKRQGLPEGHGMLFIMPTLVIQEFCMRDMRFPIDFIWLAPGRVAGITKNVPFKDQQACYASPEAVNYVLEVPAGFCDRQGIKVGDPVSW